MSETFLAHATRRKNRAGKGIIDIHGGIKWGWHVEPRNPDPNALEASRAR
jgi:hypothetical protein